MRVVVRCVCLPRAKINKRERERERLTDIQTDRKSAREKLKMPHTSH